MWTFIFGSTGGIARHNLKRKKDADERTITSGCYNVTTLHYNITLYYTSDCCH